MKKKYKTLIMTILIIISIINIMCLIHVYFSGVVGNYYFNQSLSHSTNITKFFFNNIDFTNC